MFQKTCPELPEGFVIGVDGGGTKTVAALADLDGKIVATGEAGPSSPRNIGIEETAENVAKAIKKVLIGRKEAKVLSLFIGLPAVAEEYKSKKEEIKRKLLRQEGVNQILKSKIVIDSDQVVAFRAGIKKRDGILLIAGTGCVAHGWRGNREAKTSGWGWLADEGSAFWVGQKVFQSVRKDLDGRGPKTSLTKLTYQNLKIKNINNLINFTYQKNPTQIIPQLSLICEKANKKGDKIARNILAEAAKELVLAANTVIKKLNFQKSKFPLILIGSMFNSKIILNTVKKEIKKVAPKVDFIQLKKEPVIGAVKLAIEQVKCK